MPLPGAGRHPVHPRWSAHHRPTATETMTADCTITRPTGPGRTGDDGIWVPAPTTTIYTGPCRIVAEPTAPRRRVGERQVIVARFHVAFRHDVAALQVGDLVTVTYAVDTDLVGRQMHVAEIAWGSEQWQRDVICEDELAPLPLLTDQITILRAALITGYGGSQVWDWAHAATTTATALVTPDASTETAAGTSRDVILTTLHVYVPAGTDVLATDRIQWAGRTWEVDGAPSPWPDVLSGQGVYIEFTAMLTEGG